MIIWKRYRNLCSMQGLAYMTWNANLYRFHGIALDALARHRTQNIAIATVSDGRR